MEETVYNVRSDTDNLYTELAECIKPPVVSANVKLGTINFRDSENELYRRPKVCTANIVADKADSVGPVIEHYLDEDDRFEICVKLRRWAGPVYSDDDQGLEPFVIKVTNYLICIVNAATSVFAEHVLNKYEAEIINSDPRNTFSAVNPDRTVRYSIINDTKSNIRYIAHDEDVTTAVDRIKQIVSEASEWTKLIYVSIDHELLGREIFEELLRRDMSDLPCRPSMYEYEDPICPGRWIRLAK